MSGSARAGNTWYDRTKRALDVVASLVGLVATMPIQAVVAIAIRSRIGRPVLFRQRRPGLDGQPFTMVKFRTMRDVDEHGGLVTDAERMTSFGAKLRSASLDELPTLWNVLRGDMSLVGPRPLLMKYLDRYTPTQARRHDVRPGITGLAQVSGRNLLSWEARLAIDVEYVDMRSLGLDLRILARTVRAVVNRTGVSAEGDATMPEFIGSHDQTATPGAG